jgi:hypothetical protein
MRAFRGRLQSDADRPMIAGHFGFAAAVKSREQHTPLWALMLACQWLDVVFVPLFLLGVEHISTVPGTNGGYGQVIINADYTHSLIGALALSALFGLASANRWGARSGAVLAGVTFSHWVLDLIVHHRDMAILPGNLGHLSRVGFGLWKIPTASIAIELALVLLGSYSYWRAAVAVARSSDRGLTAVYAASGLLVSSGLVTLTLDVLGY